MKGKAIEILNRICHDEMVRNIPVVYLCHITALILETEEQMEKEGKDVPKLSAI